MSWQSRVKTKRAFKELATGKHIRTYAFEPGMFPEPTVGRVTIEGPYPVHTWYAQAMLDREGIIEVVK